MKPIRPIRPIGPIARLSAALVVACCAAAGAATVDELVAKLPAATKAEGQRLAAQIVKLGPAAVKAACEKLKPPAQGGDVRERFAIHGMALYVARPEAEADRKMLAGTLLDALAAAKDREVKAFLIRQLQLCGKDEAVAPLARLLSTRDLYEPATQALLRIRTPGAVAALVKALGSARGKQRVTLVRACGDARAAAAVPEILKDAASADRTMRLTALWALANIGAPAAESVLAKAAAVEPLYERSQTTTYYLLFAQRRAEAGDKATCAKICRGLVKTRTAPRERNAVCAALRTLAGALGDAALDDIMAATRHRDKQVRAAALKLTETIPGEAMTRRWVEQLKAAKPAAKVDFLAILARRGDQAAVPAVVEAMKHQDKAVRAAALAAAAQLGGSQALSAILKTTGDADRELRRAAFRALGQRADAAMLPRLVPLLLAAKSSRDRGEIQRAVVAIAERAEDRDAAAAPLLAALPTAQGPGRAALLKTIARVGGAKALEAVTAAARKADDDAIRALAEWTDASAAPELLKIIRFSSQTTHQVLALRGYVRLVGEAKLPDAGKVKMLQDAMAAAKRPEEKRLVLSGLAAVPSADALKAVTPYLDDAALGAEAAIAVVKMAGALSGAEIVAALKKVAAVAKDAGIRQQAQSLLASVPKPEALNVARGKPVKASVKPQGGNIPARAVDGNASDKNGSAWFGARWPSWLEVDLGKPTTIDSAHVWFYWDGRYYQYKIDVSIDGKTWKTVVDASKNKTPGTERGVGHGFAPVEARYVRLHVLKNSANEAVHVVELKVYAAQGKE